MVLLISHRGMEIGLVLEGMKVSLFLGQQAEKGLTSWGALARVLFFCETPSKSATHSLVGVPFSYLRLCLLQFHSSSPTSQSDCWPNPTCIL